jgi:RNA polymerase sigma factor (sigma-70 family)
MKGSTGSVKRFSLLPYPFGDVNRLYSDSGKEGDEVVTDVSRQWSGRPESDINEHLLVLREQLLRYCEFLSGSRHDAEDLVQTTLLKALPVLQGVGHHPNVSALLRRIAKNTWFDHVRKQSRIQPCNPTEMSAVCGSVWLKEQLEVEAALQVLIQTLTPQQRAVFLLCEVFQYTDREAGELLGITRGAVKATLHRAKIRLHSILKYEDLPSDRDSVQKEILQAYVAAFRATDIPALIHLCQGDPVHATSKVLTFAQRQANEKRMTGGTQMSMLAAA